MKVRNEQLFELNNLVARYSGLKAHKVAWTLARNKSIIEGPIKDVRELTKATEAQKEFEKAKEELMQEHADRDEKNRPLWHPVPGAPQAKRYEIADEEKFNKALEKLKKNHEQAEKDLKANEERSLVLLQEEVDVAFYRLPMSKMPKEYKNENDEDGEYPIGMMDMALLFSLGILYEDEPEDDEEPEKLPAPKKEEDGKSESEEGKSPKNRRRTTK